MFLRSWKVDRREFEGSWGGLEGSLRSWKGEMGVFGGLQSLCGVSGGLGVSCGGGGGLLKVPFRDVGMDLGLQAGIWDPGGDFGVKRRDLGHSRRTLNAPFGSAGRGTFREILIGFGVARLNSGFKEEGKGRGGDSELDFWGECVGFWVLTGGSRSTQCTE